MVKNLPSNAGDSGSVPGQETKIPHAPTRASTLVVAHTCPRWWPTCSGAQAPQQKPKINNKYFFRKLEVNSSEPQ